MSYGVIARIMEMDSPAIDNIISDDGGISHALYSRVTIIHVSDSKSFNSNIVRQNLYDTIFLVNNDG
jgi:hypothetical protein